MDTIYLSYPDGNGYAVRWIDTVDYELAECEDTVCDTNWITEECYSLYWEGELINDRYTGYPTTWKAYSDYTDYRPHYDISRGGQTQLLRIRIIQVLNEYYGDFKWVNDPSAKVILLSKSNGSAVTFNFIKDEEMNQEFWYNNGENLQGAEHSEIYLDEEESKYYTNDGSLYRIDGFGFKLRDHVSKLVGFNGAMNGTSIVDKDGEPSELAKDLLRDVNTVMALGLEGKIIPPANFLAMETLLFFIEKTLVKNKVGDIGNPLIRDLGPGSSFLKGVKGDGEHPEYSYGGYIYC